MNIVSCIFLFSTVLLSCEQAKETNPVSTTRRDSAKASVDRKEEERLKRIRQNEEQEKLDQIKDDKVLEEALKIAERHGAQSRLKKSYVAAIQDSLYRAEVDINRGFYFSDKLLHLIVRRTTPGSVYIDIFLSTDNQFQKVLSHEQWSMEYVGDTIRDINGDGLKDFVVNWYGSNGCCLKGFSNVFLQRTNKASFSRNFQFINPTFSPKEQVIRGICYGHPGETAMYKYKWNREAVDTVEYIYYEKNREGKKTGRLIVSNDIYDHDKQLKRLSYVPAEYKKIEGYDWFTDKLGN